MKKTISLFLLVIIYNMKINAQCINYLDKIPATNISVVRDSQTHFISSARVATTDPLIFRGAEKPYTSLDNIGVGDLTEFTNKSLFFFNEFNGYITITDTANNVLAHGNSPLQWTATTTSIRLHWSLNSDCDAQFPNPSFPVVTNSWNWYYKIIDTTSPNVAIPDPNFEQALIDLNLDTTLDGYVTRTNVNTITNLNVSNKNINDLTGIEAFTALTELNCNLNELVTLEVGYNTALTKLYCSNNSLITLLGIGSCPGLTRLYCQNNSITRLDVSSNTDLISLSCSSNLLSTLDVSQNTTLIELFCNSNELITLDINHNTALTFLLCISNNLTSLNISNGNNINFNSLSNFTNNPDLTCIQVDNVEYANTNWASLKDATATYNESCGVLSTSSINHPNFSVYPNPVETIVTIQLEDTIEHTQLYALSGKLLKTSTSKTIDLSAFASGMYFLKITTTRNKTAIKKIIKN